MKTGLLALGRQRLERLVVLVDVQVFALGNVDYSLAYAALIHSCIERTLQSCNDHSTRHKSSTSWGYKFFDSSLSPLSSTSTILKLLKGLKHIAGFKSAEENLALFQQTLSVVAANVGTRTSDPSRSRADFVLRALQELLSDFTWNSVFISDGSSSDEDMARRRQGERHSFTIQQNLIMVFSHLPENMQQFMNMPSSSDAELLKGFTSKMKRLQEPFRVQGIQPCWIDMPCVSTSVVIHQKPQRHGVFAQLKWKYTTMDSLAIASECLPPAMVWSSVAYPDLQVQPNAIKMQAKLRITVHDRDGKRFQPDICRLQILPLGSHVPGSALMKESVSAMLKMGMLSSGKCPPLQPPLVKIVVKSLIPKHDVSFKSSLRYLLYHRAECGTDISKMERVDPLADDATSDVAGHDILKQFQQEPMSFDLGDRSWQVLLIAIARKRCVAEVDLYVDGSCSSAILEPITVQYAALLQKDQSDSSKQLLVQHSGSKSLTSSPLLHSIVKSEGADVEGSDCGRIKQEVRPRKRAASTVPVEDAPVVKREKTVGGFKQSSEETKREAYSWVQHWRYILRRKTIGTGKVHIENRYMRPRLGQKPSKAIQIIKCWLDQASKLGPQPLVPSSPATPGHVVGDQALDAGLNQPGDSERVRLDENSAVPLKGKDLVSAILNTEDRAESYLSSIEQMVRDCLQSDSGDLQVFVKGILSNATRAQRILLKKKQVRPPADSMPSPVKDDDSVKPCHSDSSCASNVSRAVNGVKPGGFQELLCSVSGVGNGANCIDYGGSSDGADSDLVAHDVGEATDESQPSSDESVLSEMVAERLMDKLLVRPKKLARQYKDGADVAHMRKEKLRAYELQILFRMEMIERDCGGPLEKEKGKIVKEICRLLDDIQFDLGGGVFGSESLHDYSIRVIQNRYKERLPQTVADIFERMEFNGYVEGVSELQAAPEPTDLVGSHDRKETELMENFTAMDEATQPFVPAVQPVEEKYQSGAIPTSSKGRTQTKSRRKRSVPMDAFTRASEKRKLASRLAHFGGPESLHRLKKVKIHHQSPKPPKVSSSAKEKYQSKDHHVVLETPRFERQNHVIAESPKSVHEEDEVESMCTRVRTSAFGFGTPARVYKHVQPTTRKRRLALFNQKKPPGRGLPRISRDVIKALAEGETMHRPANSDHQPEILAQNECAEDSTSMYVSQSSQEQRLPEPSVDVLQDSRDLSGWVLRESGYQCSPQKNESSRHTEKVATAGQAHSLMLDATFETEVIRENSCHLGVQQQVVHDFNSGVLVNSTMPISVRKNRRKSLHTSKSRKPDFSGPQNSAPATQISSPPALERDSFEPGSAAQEPVIENSKPVDLTSSENRWNDDEIPCSSPVNCTSGDAAETLSIEVAGDVSNADLAKRRGFSSASHSEELALPKANFSELGGETELLFETQVVEEKHRFRSPRRALYEDTLCLSPPWEMPCMDLNGTQDVEQVDRSSQLIPVASPGRCNLYSSTSPIRINQTSKVCRVDPPSSALARRLAAEHDVPLVKPAGLIAEDLEFTQVMNEIFHSTYMMEEEAGAEECKGRSLDDGGECFDEYSLLLDENWSPLPRLKPEARLSARTPPEFQRKKGAPDDDTVAAITGGSPVKFLSPTLNRKFRRPPEGSPITGEYPNTPNGVMNCKKRPRSTTASPKEIPKEKRNKMLRFT